MNRAAWLIEKRRLAKERMDTLFAPRYDDHWGGYINPTHRAMLERFLALCPPRGLILDAACGTGKYWPLILATGRTVIGIDQSRGMLQRARTKFPTVPVAQLGLQELVREGTVDSVICIDALENVSPEDWPLVLENLRRALRPSSPLYFTVELIASEELETAFAAGQRLGLPLVWGEHAHEGGYHYYPTLERVRAWTAMSGFVVLDETMGDGYQHFLARVAIQ